MVDAPLSVLHVIERLGRGGAERHVLDLSAALVQRGHRSHVLARAGGLADPDRTDLTVIREGGRAFGWGRPIKAACAQHAVNVVHVHSVMPLAAGTRVARHFRVPVVFTVHGWRPSTLSWRVALLKAFRPTVVVVVSDDLAGELSRRDVSSQVVHNGVPDVRRGGLTPTTPPLLLSVGRFESPKNQAILVEAVRQLRAGGCDVRLVLLGDGPQRESVASPVGTVGLADRVLLPGFQDPAPWYRQATAVVSASSWEGLSLAYVEALMWGLPLVITPTSGSAAVVEGGKNGVVTPDGSPEAIAAGITQVLHGDTAGMGRAARDLFERSFTHDAMVDRILGCYGRAQRELRRRA